MTNRLDRMFDGRLAVNGAPSAEQLREIPAARGVFLLSDEGDRPILLSTAASLRARLSGRLEAADPQQRKRSADFRAR